MPGGDLPQLEIEVNKLFFALTSQLLHTVIIDDNRLASRKCPEGHGLMKQRPATNRRVRRWGSVQWERSSVAFRPMREEFCDVPSNQGGQDGWWAGSRGLAPQNQRIWATLCFSVSGGVCIQTHLSAGRRRRIFFFNQVFLPLTVRYRQRHRRYSVRMTTTTTFQGMDPGAKSSSR